MEEAEEGRGLLLVHKIVGEVGAFPGLWLGISNA